MIINTEKDISNKSVQVNEDAEPSNPDVEMTEDAQAPEATPVPETSQSTKKVEESKSEKDKSEDDQCEEKKAIQESPRSSNLEEEKFEVDSIDKELRKQVIDYNPMAGDTPNASSTLKKVARKEKKQKKKEKPVKKPRKKQEEPRAKTELWSWEKLMSKKSEFEKSSIDSLPQATDVNICQL